MLYRWMCKRRWERSLETSQAINTLVCFLLFKSYERFGQNTLCVFGCSARSVAHLRFVFHLWNQFIIHEMDQNQLNELLLFRLSHPIDKHIWFGKSKQVDAAKQTIFNRHMLWLDLVCDVKRQNVMATIWFDFIAAIRFTKIDFLSSAFFASDNTDVLHVTPFSN